MLKSLLTVGCATALVFSFAPAQSAPQHAAPAPQHAAPAPQHYQHPAAPQRATFVREPMPQRGPDQFHPVHEPVHVYTPKTERNVRLDNPQIFKDITAYHINHYHTTVNVAYAAHPGNDRGYWAGGWYHGYWHDYWLNQDWTNWSGHYGFWLNLDGLNTFVYEYSPGVCWYWNGFAWMPWYNPPYTAYQCPY